MLKENADKISAADKTKIETAIAAVKEAIKTDETETIKNASEKLNEAWQAVSAELYKAAAEKSKAGKAGSSGGQTKSESSGPQSGADTKGEGPIIDAEVVDDK
jgi:molecular chaperone DnaK